MSPNPVMPEGALTKEQVIERAERCKAGGKCYISLKPLSGQGVKQVLGLGGGVSVEVEVLPQYIKHA